MSGLRRSRLRTGATRWDIYRDPDGPARLIEQFHLESWQAHLEQHHERLTADDQEFQQRVTDGARAAAPARHPTREQLGEPVVAPWHAEFVKVVETRVS